MAQNNNNVADNLRKILDSVGREHRLFDASHRISFEAQSIIYHEGDKLENLFFIDQGLVKLIIHLPNGRARIVRLHAADSVIGISGLLQTHHEHTAVAIDDVVAYKWPLSHFNRIKAERPDIYSQILEHFHEYLKTADTWITEFSTGSIKPRVARLIRYLVKVEDNLNHTHIVLLKSEEMAAILGVTAESVSRVIAAFKREGILETVHDKDKELYMPNLIMLAEIAAEE